MKKFILTSIIISNFFYSLNLFGAARFNREEFEQALKAEEESRAEALAKRIALEDENLAILKSTGGQMTLADLQEEAFPVKISPEQRKKRQEQIKKQKERLLNLVRDFKETNIRGVDILRTRIENILNTSWANFSQTELAAIGGIITRLKQFAKKFVTLDPAKGKKKIGELYKGINEQLGKIEANLDLGLVKELIPDLKNIVGEYLEQPPTPKAFAKAAYFKKHSYDDKAAEKLDRPTDA